MVTRIATAAANQGLVARMVEQQARVAADQMQVGTGFKSQDYVGIAQDSFQLISIENERARLQRYISNNDLTATTLRAQATAVAGMDETARTMRGAILEFSGHDLTAQSPANVQAAADLQQKAFTTLSQMQYFLTQQIDGKYIFAGAKSDTPPMSLPYTSLDEFQNFYDGVGSVFPSTRVANLVDIQFSHRDVRYSSITVPSTGATLDQLQGVSGDFISQTIDQTATGTLTFSNVAGNGKITASNAGAFRSLQVGQTILVNDTGGSTDNNGVYTITSVSPDGNTITLDQTVNAGTEPDGGSATIGLTVPNGTAMALTGSGAGNEGAYTFTWPSNADLIAAGFDLNAGDIVSGDILFSKKRIPDPSVSPETITLTSKSFLRGTSLAIEQRISDTHSIKLDVTGLDPAFEKVIRALGVIAQGDLLNNPSRVTDALAVINDAISHSALQPTEAASDLQSVADRIGNNQRALGQAKDTQTQFLAFLEGRQSELEKADTTEAAVRLQVDSQALQISFASLAKITQLSLINYL